MKKLSFGLSMFLFITSACQNENEPVVVKEEFTTKSLQIIQKTDAFSWKFFQTMNKLEEEGNNLVISPLSVSQAFGMAINGATGSNLDEMLQVFGYDDTQGMNDAYKNIRGALSTADPKVTIGIANSAWYRQGFVIKEPFFNALRQYYDAEIEGLDFNNADQSLKTINGWVNNKTKGKIPTIINNISTRHILFLVNAVYFYGPWSNKFDKANTTTAPFKLSNGSGVQVKMMYQESVFEIKNYPKFSFLRAPYASGAFAMNILLPHEGVKADEVINMLNSDEWNSLQTEKPSVKVKLYLPRFKSECKYNLVEGLQMLGIQKAFTDNMGFHNIAEAPIVISDVKHKTFIEVDEKGTEAAAATSIGFELTSMPPQSPVFRVDRPFVFIISEKTSGAVLFAGKIENPLQEKIE